jgi:hypothetical protein
VRETGRRVECRSGSGRRLREHRDPLRIGRAESARFLVPFLADPFVSHGGHGATEVFSAIDHPFDAGFKPSFTE